MTIQLKQFSAQGVGILDEKLRFTETIVINGLSYYLARLMFTANANITNANQLDYGIYTGGLKTGMRYSVILTGEPSNGIDVLQTKNTPAGYVSYIVSKYNTSKYISYLAHRPIKTEPIEYNYIYEMTEGESKSIVMKFADFRKIAYVNYVCNELPTDDVTINISNGHESVTFVIDYAVNNQVLELSNILKINAGEILNISTENGHDLNGLHLTFFDIG